MFNKILIANRGEIACRIIKTARKLGIRTVAVYSDVDTNALHVQMADEALHIGASVASESYLSIEKVIGAAMRTGAQAIHPGYGFLSENAAFAKACEENGIVFIGPPVHAIESMGSKSAAKRIMQDAGVPLVPGYHGDDQSADLLKLEAAKIGYPVLLKATAGGGGKGMRTVHADGDFDAALEAARREARKSFGDDKMLVEKYLQQPRHVEVQVFCDNHDNAVHLFERDCSVQRRHQKVIEEAPAPGMPAELRQRMGQAAINAAKAIAYRGAGTVEFLLDTDGAFYFMEMNTRLQVEHPVTEMITRQDLVEWQLLVASGEALPCSQQELEIHGHAIEVRIYAEDPARDFLPQTGPVEFLQRPRDSQDVRIDTGVQQGDEVSVFYDPMIAKLITWGADRNLALSRMITALREYHLAGLTTNISFLKSLVSTPAFRNAELSTRFIEQHEDEIFSDAATIKDSNIALALAALYLILEQEQRSARQAKLGGDPWSPWNNPFTWRLNECTAHPFTVNLAGEEITVAASVHAADQGTEFNLAFRGIEKRVRGRMQEDLLIAYVDGHKLEATIASLSEGYVLHAHDDAFAFHIVHDDTHEAQAAVSTGALTAPMTGTIVALAAEVGASVKQGDLLLIMEAMKMEHSIAAPADGVVTAFHYSVGELADGGSELLAFEAAN